MLGDSDLMPVRSYLAHPLCLGRCVPTQHSQATSTYLPTGTATRCWALTRALPLPGKMDPVEQRVLKTGFAVALQVPFHYLQIMIRVPSRFRF